MDANLYRAVSTGTDLHLLTENESKLLTTKTGNKNTVLHVASQYGQCEAVKTILSLNKDDLLLTPNVAGECPLHLAVRGGHKLVAQALIDRAKAKVEWISRPTKCQKMLRQERYIEPYTALHEAVQYHHVDIVKMLTKEDPDYSYGNSYFWYKETPLYMAARKGYHDLVEVIITNCKSPDFTGPLKRTALHAAVICNSKECVRILVDRMPTLSIMKDLDHQTPLHYVAQFGYADLVGELLVIPEAESYANIKDYYGNTSLLIAACQGHVSVMKKIISYCPDSWNMTGYKGRNILHMAIVHRQANVIEYILKQNVRVIDKIQLINKKDFQGNTPLHLLSISNFSVPLLISDSSVDKGTLNFDRMTAFDLAVNNDNPTTTELKGPGANSSFPHLVARRRKFYKSREGVRKQVQTQTVVNTLVATITFSAGFAMTGGYIEIGNEQDQGMSFLSKSASFEAFIVSDAIALFLSTTAISMYVMAGLGNMSNNWQYVFLQAIGHLSAVALAAMTIAFITGTFTVLRNSTTLASVICVLGSLYFLLIIVIFMFYAYGFMIRRRYELNRCVPTGPVILNDIHLL